MADAAYCHDASLERILGRSTQIVTHVLTLQYINIKKPKWTLNAIIQISAHLGASVMLFTCESYWDESCYAECLVHKDNLPTILQGRNISYFVLSCLLFISLLTARR